MPTERPLKIEAISVSDLCSEADAPIVPLLLSARDLAKVLNLSVATIWRLRAANKLPPPVRVGGSVRWRRSEILRYVEEL